MATSSLERLEAWKNRFGARDTARLERMLSEAARWRVRDAAGLIRLHETLLFLRAYPASAKVARLADAILFAFAARIAGLPEEGVAALAEPEVSGIAGTSLTAVFSYDVARNLVDRHPRHVEIAWDCYDNPDRLGPLLARVLPLAAEEWPVEAHLHVPSGLDLPWLFERLDAITLPPRIRADFYDALELPLTWKIANAPHSRSRARIPRRALYYHEEPLLRRSDVSLDRELEGPPLPVRHLPRTDARKILDMILDTSAMRYRQLYGFSHPDEAGVFHADAGRGVDIYFFGVPPEWRLPLRAYHAGMFFKNGVPAGYIEVLSLFERAEVGFNLYYTFREGETAWLYARLLRLFRQVLGVECFSVDAYQIGLENPEAIESGAFWFYRKLGFRPADSKVAALTAREEKRMRGTPGYRSSKRTLENLAADYVLFEGPGTEKGAWDRFRIRNLEQAVQRTIAQRFDGDPGRMRRVAEGSIARTLGIESSSGLALVTSLIPKMESWSSEEKAAAARILEAKDGGSEARWLRLMQRHRRMRAAFLAMGSTV